MKIAEIGLLHANLEYTLAGASEASTLPTWDLRMKNDVITFWLCSDTIVELKNLLVEFMTSDIGKSIMRNAAATTNINELTKAFESDAIPQVPESVSSGSNLNEMVTVNSSSNLRTRPSASSLTSATTTHQRQLTEEQQDNLKEMLSSAMEEGSISKKLDKSEEPYFDAPRALTDLRSASDDDFVHLDEALGSGITVN